MIGFIAVCDPCIEIAIAIEISEGDTFAEGVAQSLTAVSIGAGSAALIATLIDPHAVGLAASVCDPSIEIAIAIEITEGDIVTRRVAKSLSAVYENTFTTIQNPISVAIKGWITGDIAKIDGSISIAIDGWVSSDFDAVRNSISVAVVAKLI